MCGAGRVYEKIDNVYDDEETELDAEAKQVADNVGDGHHQTWEIDLAEDAGVLNEGVGCLGDTVREILPKTGSGEVEERPGYSIGRNAGYTTENYHIHYYGQRRLHHEPNRSQNGLFVLGDDVALDEQGTEVAVSPQLLEVNGQKFVFRFYLNVPLFFSQFFHTIMLSLNACA